MKKIIKLFIVCLLLVSVFTVNVKNIFASSATLVIRDYNDKAVYTIDSGSIVFDAEESTDGANDKIEALGLEVGCEYNEDENRYYATITIKKDVTLHYTGEEYSMIETEVPLLIKKDLLLSDNPVLSFTGNYNEYSVVEAEAIYCEDNLCIENVNMSFFEELKNYTYLRTNDEGDDESFEAIGCDGDYGSYISITNSNISIFGTCFVNADNYEVNFNSTSIKASLMYPLDEDGTTYHDYFQYDGYFAYATRVNLSNSNISVNINIPNIDQNRVPNPSDEMSRIVNNSVIEAEMIDIYGNSKLTINEPNYNYANGLSAEFISVNHSELKIKGCINSIFHHCVDERRGSYTSGVHFINVDFELESLLTNICMQDTTIEPVFSIEEDDNSSWHFDYMKVTGTDDVYNLYQTKVGSETIEYIKGFRCFDFYSTSSFHNQSYYSKFSDCHYLKYATTLPSTEADYNIEFNLESNEDVKNLVESAKGVGIFSTVKPPAPASLALYTHDHKKIYYTDGKTEGDSYNFPGLAVSYDSEKQLFKINVTSDCTLVKTVNDAFASFIESDGAGLEITGNKTLSFEVTYPTSLPDKYNSTKCIYFDSSYSAKVSGNDKGKLKLVVKDKTDTSKTRTYNPLTTSLFFVPQKLRSSNLEAKKTQLTIDNVDINSVGAIYLLNSGGGNTIITNSNIIYKYTDPNFSDSKGYYCVSPFLTASGLSIINSNIELTGDKSLNQEGLLDYSADAVEGGMMIQGNLTIQGCKGDKEVCIKDFFVGIGSFGNINISDSNIDVEGYHGGIGTVGNFVLSHSKENYIRIKSDEKDKINSDFTIQGGKYPAVFAFTSFDISTDSEYVIYGYDMNNTKEEFDSFNMHNYRYIEINGDAKKEKEQKEKEEHHSGGSGGHYVIPKTGIR